MADTIAAEQLRLFIERIEAKSQGYDTKTIRAIVKLRRMEKHARDEAEALLDTYKAALGLG